MLKKSIQLFKGIVEDFGKFWDNKILFIVVEH